jgi:hypothetical protein
MEKEICYFIEKTRWKNSRDASPLKEENIYGGKGIHRQRYKDVLVNVMIVTTLSFL